MLEQGPVPNPNIKWCDECEKYYNSQAPHACAERELQKNREQLEGWLKKFEITNS